MWRLGSLRSRVGRSACTAVAPVGLWQRLRTIPARYPFWFGVGFTGFKTSSADLFTQTAIEGKPIAAVDLRRTGLFLGFGLVYMGAVQYFIYVRLMAQTLWPNAGKFAGKSLRDKLRDPVGCRQTLEQVAFDQLIHVPLLFYPVYYTFKEAFMGDPQARAAASQSLVGAALGKYRKNVLEDVQASLSVWVPLNIINFGLMPLHLRIPFMGVCSFGFTVLLSVMRGGAEQEEVSTDALQLAEQMPRQVPVDQFEAVLAEYRQRSELTLREMTEALGRLGVTDAELVRRVLAPLFGGGERAVKYDQFVAVVVLLAYSNNPARHRLLFHLLDADQNGLLRREEVAPVVLSYLRLREAVLSKPRAGMFALLDKASAGYPMGLEESDQEARRRAAVQRLGGEQPDSAGLDKLLELEAGLRVLQLFSRADTDKDGRISAEEFDQWSESNLENDTLAPVLLSFHKVRQHSGREQ